MCKNQCLGRSFQKSSYIKKVSTFFYYFTIFLFSFNYSLKDDKDNSQEEKLISLDEEDEEEGICHLNKLEKTNFGKSFKVFFKKCKNLVIDNPIQFCILCLDINSNNFN